VPIPLGDGIRLYDNPGSPRMKLKLLTAEGTNLRLQVVQ
jgi:hypothetical protein